MRRFFLCSSRSWDKTLIRCILTVALAVLPLLSEGIAYSQAKGPLEYQIKGAFLYNFAKFIEWPSDALSNATATFNICVLGNDSARQELEQVLDGKSIDGHAIQVTQVHGPVEARACHILFVTAADESQESTYLIALRESSVLTVAESPGFCSRGGIINFLIESDHVRFEINPKAAGRAHLRPSSKLLSLAKVVNEAEVRKSE